MPRSNTPSPASSDKGLAALEKQVEEIQTDATIETELQIEDSEAAATANARRSPDDASRVAPEPRTFELPGAGPAHATTEAAHKQFGAAATAAGDTLRQFVTAVTAGSQAALKLQQDTFAEFAGAKGPRDLIDAQLNYSRRVVDLYASGASRIGGLLTRAIDGQARQ